MLTIDYDSLKADFNADLNDKLRSHAARHESLALWVPSEDIVEGIGNLIESALVYGERDVKVVTGDSDLGDLERARISEICGEFADVTWHAENDIWVAKVSAVGGGRAGKASRLNDRLAAEKAADIDYQYGTSHRNEMPAGFQRVLRERAEPVGSARLSKVGVATGQVVTANAEGLSFELQLNDRDEVITCSFQQSAENDLLTGLMRLICQRAVGCPVREIVDHSLNEVIASLFARVGDEEKNDLPAILLPFNLGPEFIRLHELLRDLRTELSDRIDFSVYNEYETAVSKSWSALSHAERMEQIQDQVSAFATARDRHLDAIVFVQLDDDILGRPVRVTISMTMEIPVPDRATLVRGLEAHLKATLENELQVYYVEIKDANRIRRLG